MLAPNKMPFPRAGKIKRADSSLMLIDELLMTDVKISSFVTASGPLIGTELTTGLDGGVNTNFTTAQIAALANVYNQANGTPASVTNTTQTVHSYSLSANQISSGAVYTYTALFNASNTSGSSLTGNYTFMYEIDSTPYSFPINDIVVDTTGDNTVGNIVGTFVFFNSQVGIQYQISLRNPSNAYYTTYQNFKSTLQSFVIGTDTLSVSSILETTSPNLTFTIYSSNFFGQL
jgi:hypothetical protein